MRFRPCIDLHQGRVKQIVGSTLQEGRDGDSLQENFVSSLSPSYYASLFRSDGLTGGHVIMLGPGNEEAAREALGAWPGGLQVGGGITDVNALDWLEAGASAVIVTSYVFSGGKLDEGRLKRLSSLAGREALVLDLSCRKGSDGLYYIVTDRWQKFTSVALTRESLAYLSEFCFEFLVHGVDVEGRCLGIEEELVALLGQWSPIPATYAGGIHSMKDIELIRTLGRGRLDYTVGSGLDIFGGTSLRYSDLAAMHRTS